MSGFGLFLLMLVKFITGAVAAVVKLAATLAWFVIVLAVSHIVVALWVIGIVFAVVLIAGIAEALRPWLIGAWSRLQNAVSTCENGTDTAFCDQTSAREPCVFDESSQAWHATQNTVPEPPPPSDLLTDDLAELLAAFPESDLGAIVDVLKSHKSWTPFAMTSAKSARAAGPSESLRPFAGEIAAEILWWGSHDVLRSLGAAPDWRAVLADVAKAAGVPKADRAADMPAWRIEGAIITKLLADWERMSPADRAAKIRESRGDIGAAPGGALAALGLGGALGGAELLALVGAEGAGVALGAAILWPAVVAAGVLQIAYSLAGPGYRVLRPVALHVALTRQRLRDARIAASFGA